MCLLMHDLHLAGMTVMTASLCDTSAALNASTGSFNRLHRLIFHVCRVFLSGMAGAKGNGNQTHHEGALKPFHQRTAVLYGLKDDSWLPRPSTLPTCARLLLLSCIDTFLGAIFDHVKDAPAMPGKGRRGRIRGGHMLAYLDTSIEIELRSGQRPLKPK